MSRRSQLKYDLQITLTDGSIGETTVIAEDEQDAANKVRKTLTDKSALIVAHKRYEPREKPAYKASPDTRPPPPPGTGWFHDHGADGPPCTVLDWEPLTELLWPDEIPAERRYWEVMERLIPRP
jgi:hypothetical protein